MSAYFYAFWEIKHAKALVQNAGATPRRCCCWSQEKGKGERVQKSAGAGVVGAETIKINKYFTMHTFACLNPFSQSFSKNLLPLCRKEHSCMFERASAGHT